MKNDEAEPYREIDFSGDRRGPVIEPEPGKTKIRVIEHFRALVERAGVGTTKR